MQVGHDCGYIYVWAKQLTYSQDCLGDFNLHNITRVYVHHELLLTIYTKLDMMVHYSGVH